MGWHLDPCPFCGSVAEIHGPLPDDVLLNGGGYVVECSGCQASSAVVIPNKDDPRPRLTELWNVRAKPLPDPPS